MNPKVASRRRYRNARALPTLSANREFPMSLNAHKDPMTDEQRRQIQQLCRDADIPDKSGELLTRSGAQAIIEELQRKASEHQHKS
jgi:hypothetical protein